MCYLPGNTRQLVRCDSLKGILGYQSTTNEISVAFYDGHDGYDWALRYSPQEILAASSGKVESIIDDGAYGRTITIDHLNGYKTKYSHLTIGSEKVKTDECVEAGQPIALQGHSGGDYKNHLHFRVLHNGNLTDPFGFCYDCEGNPRDPLIDFNGEASQNLWYGTLPRTVGLPPTRQDLGMDWDAFPSEYLGGPGDFPILNEFTDDQADFLSDLTIPDGYFVSPGQTLTKTWRLRNSGTSTWGAGYKLVFVGGEQMEAPKETMVLPTVPNATADLSVIIKAPSSEGEHTGYFQMRNPQGTYFGDKIWVKINVKANSAPGGNISVFDLSPASPSQATQVHLLGRASWFPEFRSIRFVIGNQSFEKPNFRTVGNQVEISMDWSTASLPRGTYNIILEVAKNGDNSWSSPERQLKAYTLTGTPTSTNRPPDRPILLSPYNWYLKDAGGSAASVELCVRPATDPDGNSVTYSFEVNNGAITSGLVGSCWSHTYDAGTYSWRVKSSDGTLFSDWSAETWNFTVAKGGVYIGGMSLYNPYNSDTHICVPITYDGINAPDVYAWMNLASDGSQNGEWKMLDHYGPNATPDCTSANVHGWWIRSQDYDTGNHAIKVNAVKRDSGANQTSVFSYNIAFMRPPAPTLITPSSLTNNGTWWNTPTINFQWSAVARVTTYTLRVSTKSDPWSDPSPILNLDFGSGVTSYTYNFSQDYNRLYWIVRATNATGSADTGGGVWFGIDHVKPTCQVQALAPVYYDNFQVKWSGSDDSAGIHSYDIQVSDTNRDSWRDWLLDQPSSKGYEQFIGQAGHTYYFRCKSTDNAVNTNDYPQTADTFTKIDPAARPPEPWWKPEYSIKRTISIQNNMPGSGLPAFYPINVRFTPGTPVSSTDIYNASQSAIKCDDLRIVQNNTTEINRYIKTCTANEIEIWFRSLAAISGSGIDNSYQLYIANPAAGNPPADASQIWYPSKESDTTNLYLFQEGSGSTTKDYSGNNRNCTINPTVQWTTAKWGSGLQFNRANNGSTISLTCGSPYPLHAFTVEFWYRPGVQDLGARVTGQLGPSNQLSWLLSIEGDRMKFERWCNGGSQQAQGDINFRNSPYFTQWNYLALTFDGGNQVKFYVNGNLDKAVTLGNSCNATYNIPLEIGSVEGSGQGSYSIGAYKLSNTVKTNFAPAAFVAVKNEPTTAIGLSILPPTTGKPDLAILSLNAYPNPDGGILVEAVVENQGTVNTTNGFFTDLYVDHLPNGAGDYY